MPLLHHRGSQFAAWDQNPVPESPVSAISASAFFVASFFVALKRGRAPLLPCVALAGFLALHSPALGAQAPAQDAQSLKNLSLEQLGELEVTTYSKTPSELWDTPAAVYVITSEQIRRSGATSIADALRLAPGVEVGRNSSDTWAVGIRGLENDFSKSVLVLIDGRNVYTPLLAGVYWDVQDMPLDDIDRIEVIRGPGGTIWGPNAANGVINIITRNSRDTHGISAGSLAGTEDHTIDDLQYGAAARGVDYRLFGRGFERRHEYHSNGIDDDTWHQERLGFRADKANGGETYFLSGDLYKGDSPQILSTTPWDTQVAGGDINARWEHDLSREKGFYVQAYVSRALRSGVPVDDARNTYDIDFIDHFRAGDRNLFSYGGTLHWSTFHVSPELFSVSTGTDYEHTGFVQDEVRVGRDVWITAGTKLEGNNYSGFDLQPSGRILWSSGERQALWGGVTRAVTTPSDLEENYHLQGSVGDLVIQVLGNHNFKSEDVIGYEVGYRRLLAGKVYASLSSFWNQYNHLQSFSPAMITTSGGFTYISYQYQNLISGSTSGGELATESQIAHWWRLNVNYSFLSSDFTASGPTANISDSGSVQTYDASSPKHMVAVQSLFELPGRIQFDPLYRFITALPAQKVPAYQTMDLHFEKAFGRNWSLELVGQNLFQDVHSEWGTGDPNQPLVGIYRAGYARLVFHSGR
jgi:iron complex outermembrane recepter protein